MRKGFRAAMSPENLRRKSYMSRAYYFIIATWCHMPLRINDISRLVNAVYMVNLNSNPN